MKYLINSDLKALVIGYGSIGKRHKRVLQCLGVNVDVYSRRKFINQFDPNAKFYNSIDCAFDSNNYDLVVIANETSQHLHTMDAILKRGYKKRVLLEKPVSKDYIRDYDHGECEVYVGYNLRFHPLIKKLKSLLKNKTIFSAVMYCGQFLPDWRPNVDYRKSYSAIKESGGGVLRDLSHEIDLAQFLFGDIQLKTGISGKISALDITSDDHAVLHLSSDNSNFINIILNSVDRLKQRFIIVNCDDNTYRLDFNEGSLLGSSCYFSEKINGDFTYSEMYLELFTEPFPQTICNFKDAQNVMQLINHVESKIE